MCYVTKRRFKAENSDLCAETVKEAVLWLRAKSDFTGGVILKMVHGNLQTSWTRMHTMPAEPP